MGWSSIMGRQIWVVEGTYKCECYNIYTSEDKARRAVEAFRERQGEKADYWDPRVSACVVEGQAFGGVARDVIKPDITTGETDDQFWVVYTTWDGQDHGYESQYRVYFSAAMAREAAREIPNAQVREVVEGQAFGLDSKPTPYFGQKDMLIS